MAALERRAIAALRAFGVLMTDTCINYQTIMAPVQRRASRLWRHRRRHLFEQRASARAAISRAARRRLPPALTGRTPRYGYHLDECRRATRRFRLTETPRDLAEWGAVGGIVGEACGSYWQVPLIEGVEAAPGSDALKHFGAAMASFGSVALFHMPGITAEDAVFAGPPPEAAQIGRAEIDAFLARYAAPGDKLDVVVFGAPQLSLFEIEAVAAGARRAPRPSRHDTAGHDLARDQARRRPHGADPADRGGGRDRRRRASAFTRAMPREMAEANGWTRLMTNSAKLVNIIGGYGYRPTSASLERCVDSAVAGRVL